MSQPITCEHEEWMNERCDECGRKRGWYTAGCVDVFAAVERAAAAGAEVIRQQRIAAGHPPEHVPGWAEVPEYLKAIQRDHVRPIVLAALGIAP